MRIKSAATQQRPTCKPQKYSLLTIHCKNFYRFSRSQPDCHLPVTTNSPWPGIIKLFLAREGFANLFYNVAHRGTHINRISPLVTKVKWFGYRFPIPCLLWLLPAPAFARGGKGESVVFINLVWPFNRYGFPFPIFFLHSHFNSYCMHMYTQLYSKVSPAAMRLKSICCITKMKTLHLSFIKFLRASCQTNETLFHIIVNRQKTR